MNTRILPGLPGSIQLQEGLERPTESYCINESQRVQEIPQAKKWFEAERTAVAVSYMLVPFLPPGPAHYGHHWRQDIG